MKTKNGDKFYVKTYGGKKWMVYIRKYHVGTFLSEQNARKFAENMNETENGDEFIRKIKAEKEEERMSSCGILTYVHVLARLKGLKADCANMSESIQKTIDLLENVMERNGDAK